MNTSLFIARKFILYLIKPYSLMVLVLFVSGIRRKSRLLIVFSIIMYLMGTTWFADFFIRPLEKIYTVPKSIDRSIKYVVVITGGMYSRETPLSSSGCSSTKRLIAAYTLCKKLKNCRIVLSGGSLFGKPAGAKVWANILKELGTKSFIVEPLSKTTYENAAFVKKIVKDRRFYLVTSAYHMPRSILLFKKLGLKPIAYPTDFLSEKDYTFMDFFPQGRNIRKLELALHEYMGLIYYGILKKKL